LNRSESARRDQAPFKNWQPPRKREGQREIEAGEIFQQEIEAMLKSMDASAVYKNRPDFEECLASALDHAGIKLPAPLRKAILNDMSERDESAEICLDADGGPEPDAELRDYENVPLKEDTHAYIKREVLPHVPDAWIDESKTRIGYEIPFNLHFYKFTPPRPLEEIKAEIKTIEQDILRLLAEVTA
jgi:type I restriction enzyme M protein